MIGLSSRDSLPCHYSCGGSDISGYISRGLSTAPPLHVLPGPLRYSSFAEGRPLEITLTFMETEDVNMKWAGWVRGRFGREGGIE